jgi:hypothetical protein
MSLTKKTAVQGLREDANSAVVGLSRAVAHSQALIAARIVRLEWAGLVLAAVALVEAAGLAYLILR